ncbi:MAG: hypothetical protein NT154_01770 [Verrucomicrobia bacterium]|nr:hypothetical protein [Verrucomicrobiota bacterium]
MFLKQSQELLLKRHLPMLILLGLDVLNGLVRQRDADAEGAVFDLLP